MGLLRGVARTAAIAGTATAVSNGVSRRQGARWSAQEQQQQAAAQQQAYEQPPAVPDQRLADGPSDDMDGKLEQLEKLGQLRTAGVLTDEEFQTQKAAILGG